MDALTSEPLGRALEDKWMIMPDMKFLIAQRYKYAVVLRTGNSYLETYFPLEGQPPHADIFEAGQSDTSNMSDVGERPFEIR
ncbi:hypothetical protein A2U01_0055064 [Trifolium medium]|uniref:Uncharacterized protein n=1 Tax=Trifolium medium TaxID=97028 RepID=A0A392RDD3_9FABA|nr:hypothetical protein [Trifolium medium]